MAAKIDAIAGATGWVAVHEFMEDAGLEKHDVAFWGLIDGEPHGFVYDQDDGFVRADLWGGGTYSFEGYDAPSAPPVA